MYFPRIEEFSPTEYELLHNILKDPESDYPMLISILENKIDSESKNLSEELERKVQKQAEEALKREKRFTETALNAQRDTFFVFEPLSGNAVRWNKAFNEVSGYTDDEIIKLKAPLSYYNKEDLDKLPDATELIERGETAINELYLKTKNGNLIPTEYASSGIFSDEGNLKYIVSIGRDITMRKKAEEELKIFKNISDNANYGIGMIDFDGTLTYVNNYFANIHGYEPDDIIGKNFGILHNDDQLKRIIELKEKLEVEGSYHSEEVWHMHKNGSIFPTLMNGVSIKDEKGEMFLAATVIDISDQYKAKQKLKESEERYRHLFERSANKIILLDLKGTIIGVNSPFLEYFGYSRDELLGEDFREKKETKKSIPFSPKDATFLNRIFEEAISKGKFEPIEFFAYDKNNDERWIELRASLIELEENKMVQVIIQDIDERKRAEEALRLEKDKLQAIIDGLTSAGLGIDIIGDDYKVLFMNEKLKERFGDTIGKLCYESYTESKEPCEGCSVMKSIKNNTIEHVELIGSDNRNYEIFSAPLPNSNGTIDKSIELIIDITERKKAELNLRESEEKFRTITEQSLMGICIAQDNIMKYINKKYADIWGYSTEEMMDWQLKDAADALHPDDRDFVLEQFAKKQSGEQDIVAHYSYRGFKKSGEIIWIEQYSKTINYENSPADLITLIDITEKKEAEQKLKESEEKYRNLLNNIHESVFELDEKGNIIYISPQVYDITGYKPEEQIGVNLVELIHPEDLELVSTLFNKLLQSGEIQSVEFRRKHKDGHYIYVNSSGRRIKIGDKYKIIGTTKDITERKKAQEKLKESEEKFRTISEQSLIGIGILQDNIIKYLNEKFADILGYTIDEILNWSPKEFLKSAHPDDRTLVSEQARKKQEGLNDYLMHYQFRALKKSGETIWIDNFTRSIQYEGRPADLVTFIDITEKKKVEEELIKLNNMKSELLTRTSHELKTPLIAIKGYSNLLLELHKDHLEDYVVSALDGINEGCFKLENLIMDILKTAELDSGKLKLRKTREELSFLIKLCVADLRGLLELRNHTLDLKIQGNLITYLEKEQIHEVISNLLTNAIKFTPPNGKIEITSEIKNDFIITSIIDNGIGFTEEEQERIFEKFGKIERYGQKFDVLTKGSGLGLYISKKIVELHGGEIWFESEGRNKGSTFYFSLPLISD